jgi:hypothetical protein
MFPSAIEHPEMVLPFKCSDRVVHAASQTKDSHGRKFIFKPNFLVLFSMKKGLSTLPFLLFEMKRKQFSNSHMTQNMPTINLTQQVKK